MDKIEKKIDNLAEIMMGGFDRLDDRIDGLAGQVDGLAGQVDGLAGQVDGLDQRVGQLKSEVRDVRLTQGKHTEILDKHSVILKQVSGDIEAFVKDDLDHGKRIGRLERKVLSSLV